MRGCQTLNPYWTTLDTRPSTPWPSTANHARGTTRAGSAVAPRFDDYAQATEVRDAFARHKVRYLFIGNPALSAGAAVFLQDPRRRLLRAAGLSASRARRAVCSCIRAFSPCWPGCWSAPGSLSGRLTASLLGPRRRAPLHSRTSGWRPDEIRSAARLPREARRLLYVSRSARHGPGRGRGCDVPWHFGTRQLPDPGDERDAAAPAPYRTM